MSSATTSALPPTSPAQAASTSQGTSPSSSQSSSSPDSTTNDPPSSSPVPSSTANTPTTPTPVAPPSTTPQSSPVQLPSVATTAIVPFSSPAPSASAAPSSFVSSSTSAQAASSSIYSYTSQVASTYSSTNPAGSVVIYTTTVPDVITTTVSSGSSSSSNSHTAVIVGAVVGGVAGIAIIILLLFCIRRRVRKDDFDGDFDPDRVVGHSGGGGATLPNVDLADEVTPFPHAFANQSSASMRQYAGSSYHALPSTLTGSGDASTDFYASKSAGASIADAQPRSFVQPGFGSPPLGAYVPPHADMYGTSSGGYVPAASPPPSTVSQRTSSTRAAKEREAMGRAGQGTGLGLATQQEAAEGSADVVVHQDAGRAPDEEHPPPREIPPSYDSIRRD